MYISFSRVMTAEVTQIIIAKILKNFVECLPNYFVLFLSILRGFLNSAIPKKFFLNPVIPTVYSGQSRSHNYVLVQYLT